jgi:hypothetical protein
MKQSSLSIYLYQMLHAAVIVASSQENKSQTHILQTNTQFKHVFFVA